MKRFSIVENGYDVDEVNRFIDIVIGRLEKLNAENAETCLWKYGEEENKKELQKGVILFSGNYDVPPSKNNENKQVFHTD